ncbi:MAG TPA: Uma2 family endonuclease [Ktedonobacteraceae bacterium]|nr:Uma2 family endonuclease [Ktedonobacteraceae bacterium]
MATNPKSAGSAWNWPRRGGAMPETAFHELEQLSPDRRYEYLDGMAYLMSGDSVAHHRITCNIGYALDVRLRSGPCRAFGVDVQVLLGTKKNNKKHYAYPDATVSCSTGDRRPENTLIESPRVVFEILSPSTEARDRGVKFKAYQACPTIHEIVLVSQFAPYVEIWQRDDQDSDIWHYRHYGPGEVVEINSIDARIDIADIYQGLDFEEAEPGEE